jgi:hypothetical protein
LGERVLDELGRRRRCATGFGVARNGWPGGDDFDLAESVK